MSTRVVHCKKEKFDVYIGRPNPPNPKNFCHFGNPFSHLPNASSPIKVETRDQAVVAFDDWINERKYQNVNPEQRKWILENLPRLKNKIIACWCSPKRCHGDILAHMADLLD